MTEFGILAYAGAMSRGGSDGLSYQEAKKITETAEEHRYDVILLPDEMVIESAPVTECWVTLAALAAQSRRIKLGPYVTCNSYRHPAILAKMAASFDIISGGRLQFYLGACGWGQEHTHKVYGLRYPNLEERVDMLKEAIRVIRTMWSQDNANFNGRYYSIRDAICEPKPLQKPMEIWTGGSSDLLIKAAAEVADGWDTAFCTLQGFIQMSNKLDRACESMGRDSKRLRRSMHWHSTLIGKNKDQVEEKKRRYLPSILDAKSRHPTQWIREMTEKEYVERRFLIGTPEEIVEKLSGFIDHGCNSFNFVFPDAVHGDSIALLADGVISKLR